MPVREISNENLSGELTSAADKLVMVDFFATWFDLRRKKQTKILLRVVFRCGPCKQIAPFIEQLSCQYPNAVFLKADVEKCTVKILFFFLLRFQIRFWSNFQTEATKYSIKAMPTFVFFQNGKEVARLQGASKDPIEQTLKKFYKDTPSKDIGYVRRRKRKKAQIQMKFSFSDRFEIVYRRKKFNGVKWNR